MNSSATSSALAPCRLCLIRHGETQWNTERRLQGQIDIPLNPTGIAQAEAAARSLEADRFSALYSSDLGRAAQTAAAITRRHGLPARLDERLRERHFGFFQGLTYDEAERRHPEFYKRFKARDPKLDPEQGGESLESFAARIAAVMSEIVAAHGGETVLIVTHGGVLDIVYRLSTGRPLQAPRDFLIPNAAFNWVEYSAADDGATGKAHESTAAKVSGRWRLITWADDRHLGGALDELPHP